MLTEHLEHQLAPPPNVVAKVLWRLIPFMVLCYFMNYMDRVNIQFAKLEMNSALGLNDAQYGFGAGIFFIGYCLFEVPSNLIMARVGARIWMARIMISWGLVSALMLFMTGVKSFYSMRFLLGVAEAGFFPGMVYYLSMWVPRAQRARALAWFLTSTALAGVIGGPVAGMLLGVRGRLAGWQWLFLLEGLPTIALGILMLRVLRDRPAQASWLSGAEKRWLEAELASEHPEGSTAHHRLRDGLAHPRVWMLAAVYSAIIFGFYTINYWTASLLKEVSGASTRVISTLSAIPFLSAAIAMVLVGLLSDRRGNRRAIVAICAAIGAAGIFGAAASHSMPARIVWLSVAAAGIWSTLGPFWAMPSRLLRGTAAAAGIAVINSIGNLIGGFIGPTMMGHLKMTSSTYWLGLVISASVVTLASVLVMFVPDDEAPGQ